MKKTKRIIAPIIIAALSAVLLTKISFAGSFVIARAVNSKGGWQKGIIAHRQALFTGKPFLASEIRINVPKAGSYQLFAYVHHNWRKESPVIYVEGVDSENKCHRGYHRIEPIWYLPEAAYGRWFFVSLSGNPYWQLPSGELSIRFWAGIDAFPWEDITIEPVSIEDFFLLPVENSKEGIFSPSLLSPETANGIWESVNYETAHATGLIESKEYGSTSLLSVNVPKPAYYRVLVSVFSPLKNNLKLIFGGQKYSREIDLEVRGRDTWFLADSKPVYLSEGNYSLSLVHRGPNKIMIDYLIMVPEEGNI